MITEDAYFRKQSREHHHFCLSIIAPIESIFFFSINTLQYITLLQCAPTPCPKRFLVLFDPLLLISTVYIHALMYSYLHLFYLGKHIEKIHCWSLKSFSILMSDMRISLVTLCFSLPHHTVDGSSALFSLILFTSFLSLTSTLFVISCTSLFFFFLFFRYLLLSLYLNPSPFHIFLAQTYCISILIKSDAAVEYGYLKYLALCLPLRCMFWWMMNSL